MRRLSQIWSDRSAAAAVEMAFVLPGFLFLLMGASNLVLVTYANTCLNAATEAGARYASVRTVQNSGTAPTQAAVSAYATSIYKGPGVTNMNFTYTTTGTCGSTGGNGNVVTGSGSYHLFYGIGNISIAMNTTACFP
jgi:Flp pilus assembly protein TadG